MTRPELRDNILGIAHITGGGFSDNVYRILSRSEYKNPDECHSPLTWNLNFELNNMFDYLSNPEYGITDVIELYKWVQSLTRTSMKDMFKTFNCGIGMVFIMKEDTDINLFKEQGFDEFIPLGKVIEIPEMD